MNALLYPAVYTLWKQQTLVNCGMATEVGVFSAPAYVFEKGVINFRTSAVSLTLLVFHREPKGTIQTTLFIKC